TNLIEGEKFVLRYFDSPENPLNERGELYRGSLYDTATGRAMLCSMKQKELKAVTDKVGLPTQKEWEDISSFEQLYRNLSEIAKDPVVKIIDRHDDYCYCRLAIAFTGKKDERFALGVELKKKGIPEEKEILFIEKNMLLAMKEIRRRIEFEKI
ncbi:MAG: hypothetical protein K5648_00015, partial [Erysipelotrichaceae bacterium]|nr:hypothetical protein [Erysipelotrichaceae bacterium]